MTRQLIAAFSGNESIADSLCSALGAEKSRLQIRHFPDGEGYVRHEDDVAGCNLIIVWMLGCPGAKFLPLIFAAPTARNLVLAIFLVSASGYVCRGAHFDHAIHETFGDNTAIFINTDLSRVKAVLFAKHSPVAALQW